MKKYFFYLVLFPFFVLPQPRTSINIDELWGMKRLGTVDVSPDGKTIAFTLSTFSMDLNKGKTDIFLIDADGENLRPFKDSEKSESEPKFSPDGKKLAYTFENQIWIADLDGSNEKKLSDIYTGASGFKWSADGKKILFVSSVYPDCSTDDCNKNRDEYKENSKVKASLFTELMYRHWNSWRGEKRSHLFILDVESGVHTDMTLLSKFDVPPISLGSSNDYNLSPDVTEVVFTMNTDEFLATSTNNDIFVLNLADVKEGYRTPYRKISVSEGVDHQPVYSPDGKYIAFCSMERPGFEADKLNLILYDRAQGTLKNLTTELDFSVGEFVWSTDSKNIFFNSDKEINKSIFRLEIESGKVDVIFDKGYNSTLRVSPDGAYLYFKHQNSRMPDEIFALNLADLEEKQITNINTARLAKLQMNPVETFWSDGADGTPVESIILKPPFFREGEKYPMIFLIHGGPQGSWSDQFHYRWNMQMFAAPGYVVVAPNPRGSTGYGQKFTDEISQDWAGKVYVDLMNAYDHAIENFPFIDANNTFAAGASYGGYMINWIAGHTDRFNALVSHAGVFNLESMYGTTEELWFPEWEFGGTPWENREMYEKWSPHRYIHNCTTPVLVTHGANDFRVSEEQAFQLFTSLQRLGVESQFLYFPDETHFVAKPQNSRLWWKTIFEWFNKHYKMELP